MTLIKSKMRLLVVVLLLLGEFFRFVNIDKKYYWYDEAFTSRQISGYPQTEVLHEISSGQLVGGKRFDEISAPQ
jgi:uncharacterized membrane protein